MRRKLSILLILTLLVSLAVIPAQAAPILSAGAADSGQSILIAVAVCFVISLIVVLILRSGMKNVRAKLEADTYVTGDLHLTQRQDRYTHTTTVRTKIQSNNNNKR